MDKKHTKSIKTKLFLTNIMGDDRTIIEKNHIFILHKYSW